MPTTTVKNPWTFTSTVSFGDTVSLPANTIGNTEVTTVANDRIDAEKLEHRVDLNHYQADGSDVVSETIPLRVCRAAGELISIEVRPITAPTGGDKQYTVDIQKAADGSASYATMLSAAIVVDNSSVDETLQAGTLVGTPTTADGDCLQLVITASGSTGSQGQGFIVTAVYQEDPA